ncbi:MAG: hypothetical protein RIS53_283 [Bacillota bacterium]
MDGKTYFLKKKKGAIGLAIIAALSGPFLLYSEQNAYELASSDAMTSTMTKVITVAENGDVNFQENLNRYFATQVFFQDIYFTSDHEDVPKEVSTPAFDTTRFSSNIYDANDQLMIASAGAYTTTTYNSNPLILGYSWDSNSVDEFGNPIEPLDPESVAWFHYNAGTWGNIRIENNYWINGVALKYADTAEFFWVVAATDNMLTENIDVKVILPGVDLDADLVTAYLNGSSLASIHHIGANEENQTYVHIKASRLYPSEYITVRINFPADRLVIDAEQDQTYGNDVTDFPIANGEPHLTNVQTYEAERASFRNSYQMVDMVAIGLFVLIVIFAAWKVRDIYLKFDKEHQTDFYGEYYRELPAQYGPAIMGYLYRFKEVAKDDVTATLMELIRQKVILLDAGTESLTEANVNYVMKLNKEVDQNKLLPHEKQLIQWFFGLVAGGDTLSLNQLEAFTKKETQAIRYLSENQAFNRAVVVASENEKFFDDVKAPAQKNAAILGLITLFAIGFYVTRLVLALGTYTGIIGGILIGISILLGAYLSSIERRSKKGNEDYVRWKAFEKFLKEFTNIKDYPMPGMTVWEHYMVYATAFGIAELVEKQIRFKYQQLNKMDELNRSPYFRRPGFYRHYQHSMQRSFVSAQSTIAAANAQRNNSAGRGGGRFGGGGGFRGGGGSGVRIR